LIPSETSGGVCEERKSCQPLERVNRGAPSAHTPVTTVLIMASSSPLWKLRTICAPLVVSTRTRQSFSGCAMRSLIAVPVHRAETSPPWTLMVLSCGAGVTGAGAGAGAGTAGGVTPLWSGGRLGRGVGAAVTTGAEVAAGVGVATDFAVGFGLGFAGGVVGSLPIVGVFRDGGGRVLTLAVVMSRPALSMATHAVADTPATANTQIAAMPAAERRLVTMGSLCHLLVACRTITNDTMGRRHIA